MTDRQHDLIKRMAFNNYFLVMKTNYHGRRGYMLYDEKVNPIRWYQEKTVDASLWSLLKKDKRNRFTLNLSMVRKEHGNTLIKKFYKQK